MAKYQDQLKRVERYFQRVENLCKGIGDNEGAWIYCDDVYTFFMHCYHLKDYLKNDSEYTRHTNSEIENYILPSPQPSPLKGEGALMEMQCIVSVSDRLISCSVDGLIILQTPVSADKGRYLPSVQIENNLLVVNVNK